MIPFERQLRLAGGRPCAAAALAMVYRSLGLEQDQSDIWRRVAEGQCARTYRLAKDAVAQGFDSVVVQAARPWETLRQSAAQSIPTILNVRLNADSPLGHFVVLLDADDHGAVLHDPQKGPNRQIDRDELLALWSPGAEQAEIVGRVLVAVAKRSDSNLADCSSCGQQWPTSVACPVCGLAIRPRPHDVLGCLNPACPERLWEHLWCPGCDKRFSEM